LKILLDALIRNKILDFHNLLRHSKSHHKGNAMKYAVLAILLFFAAAASADTYKWEDKNGVHFTDNLSSVPKKYRKKALAEASGDITIRDPEVKASVDRGNRRRQAVEAQEAAEERAEARARAAIVAEKERARLAAEERKKMAAEIAREVYVPPATVDFGKPQRDRDLRDIKRDTQDIKRAIEWGY
jgi:signal transduction histidine kinase